MASEADTEPLPLVEDGMLRLRMGALLVEAGVVTPEQRDAALSRQARTGERFGDIVLDTGVATEEDIANALCRQLHLPRADFSGANIDEETASMMPARSARDRCCAPLRREGSTLHLAMADPLDIATINEVEASFRVHVAPCVATPSELEAFLNGMHG